MTDAETADLVRMVTMAMKGLTESILTLDGGDSGYGLETRFGSGAGYGTIFGGVKFIIRETSEQSDDSYGYSYTGVYGDSAWNQRMHSPG